MTRTGIEGTMRQADGVGVVRVESWYATEAEDLWEALTRPERLARWLGVVDGDLRLGGAFSATFVSGWSGPGLVEVCEPPRRLLVRTGADAEETLVEAILTSEDGGTRLVVEERGLPPAQLAAYGAGWQVHLEDLGHHLHGTTRTDWQPRWLELVPDDRDREVATT